jgi:spermidine synthase
MSAGGALGGLFVSLGAPRVFTTFAEWPVSLIAVMLLACGVLMRAMWSVRKKAGEWSLLVLLAGLTALFTWLMVKLEVISQKELEERLPQPQAAIPAWALWLIGGVIVICIALLVFRAVRRGSFRVALLSLLLLGLQNTVLILLMCDHGFKHEAKLERVRNFYGMLAVEEDKDFNTHQLTNGTIIHGMQNMNAGVSEEPTTYYGHHTGIGKALDSLKERQDARVGVVGMGAGTVSCYARSGHTFRFYDINPDVVRIAKKHFTYLADLEKRGARLEIVVADARLAMDREKPQNFDVLLLDAFSGDSVPVHLLTQEAFAIYKRHMKPDGIIAVHITNSYLVLAPVIEKIAADAGYKTTRIATESDNIDHDSTDYILVTNNTAFLAATPPVLLGNEIELKHDIRLWTDRYHNLPRILDIPQNVKKDAE